ncbi:uncharacterized protein [Solanum tuberosum]|uniref:uncharacterized protein n=1 Tax=Solanum tuberosum TaxID=4113 RepID=UPI000739FBDE|nr:PREDICTED: uncharacterized protein LOC107059082 [Solanum tuberosum]
MGFDEVFIDMVWRIMANNWYSIVVNGKRHGFFHSTRGLKQGDPLSPTLFILGAEVLSRFLNKLHRHPDYSGFYMEPRGPQVNHLSFADDIILFTSGRQKTLKLIMQTLNNYEEISGQLINSDKSHYMVHTSAFNSTRDRIKRITGWQTRLLSYGGREILVKHVLQSLPIHLLSAVTPPVTVLKQVQSIMADFFWGWKNERKKYHWASWKNLSFPCGEGGNFSFWWDNWLGVGPLAEFSSNSNRLNNITVAEFWVGGQWNQNMLTQLAPSNYLADILSTRLYIQQAIPDQAIWKLNSDGKTGLDTIDHIFNNGHFATYVWKSFAAAAGIVTDHRSLIQLILQWWSAKYNKEAHKLLLQVTPIFICWNLWKNHCASKYGGKSSNISRIKYAIYKDNYKLMCTLFPQIKWPSNWKELFLLGENYLHDTKVVLIKWIKPPARWVKINTDGIALSNKGRIGAGGILRDQEGEMLLAFATTLGEGTNNQAEIGAAIFGMTWVLQLGYKKVFLEVDSQLLVE